jgi:hypothetical protein
MKHTFLVGALTLSALCAGCVGTGPNTQQGAVTGGALGALAGGIIGNNSGHQTWAGAAIGAAVGALAGGTIGNSVDNQQGTLYRTQPVPVYTRTVQPQIPPAPPPPATPEAVTAAPSPDAVWIPGYWAYDGMRYNWIAAHWEMPPPNCRTYVAPQWGPQSGGYVYAQGYWR